MADVSISQTAKLISDADNILIVTHSHPDEDTLGSALAIKYAFPEKNISIACDDTIRTRSKRVFGEIDFNPSYLEGKIFDFIIFVDIASLSLSGNFGQSLEGKIDLKIDHHKDGDRYGKYNLIDPDASACGELIYLVLKEANRLNDKSNQCVYCAISADTGGFKYSCVTPRTYRIAAELLEQNVDTAQINHLLFECITKKEIIASNLTYEAMRFFYDNQIAVVTFSNKMKEDNGLTEDDLGDIISYPRRIEGVELSIVIKQQSKEEKTYKISMRSGKKITANRMCLLFGGGGHMNASGATITADSPEEAENFVIGKVLEELEKNG